MVIGVSEVENPQADSEELHRAEICVSIVVLEDATLNCDDP